MKRNGSGSTWRNGQNGFGMKRLIALILALAMMLVMLCATAEDSDGISLPDDTIKRTDVDLYLEDESTFVDKGSIDIVLTEDAILDEDMPAIDEVSLDGIEDNLLVNNLTELNNAEEDTATPQTSNASNPADFEIDENGVLVGYVGPGGDVVIPDGVTYIGERAFSDCHSLTRVTIPYGVISIGEKAFYNCSRLTKAIIPGSVHRIGEEAFCLCSSLTGMTIPNSVTSIGKGAFCLCSSLTGMAIPNSVTSISDDTFSGCSDLTRVIIPDSVTSIGECAFSNCSSLTNVTIPYRYANIGEYAFSGCSSLTSVTIPDGILNISDYTFCGCSSLTSVTIPNGVTSIGEAAFSGCSSLTSVTIPNSVTSIGYYAFGDCDSLLTIYGYEGSCAEAYAKDNNISFVAIETRKVELSACKITVKDQVYTGKYLTPDPKVKYGSTTLKQNVDYSIVGYEYNKWVGLGFIKLKGKGKYTGTVKVSFKINPKKVTGLKLSAGKAQLTAKWNKDWSGITGYQVQYALKSYFSGAKIVTVKDDSTVKCTLKKLKSGKNYYVRVRAYKIVHNNTYYSAWSGSKKVKVR